MRARCGVLVGLVALAACGSSSGMQSRATSSPAPPAATSHASCGPPGSRTLAVDRAARVYEQGGQVYGCAGARRSLLGASGRSLREGRAGPFALAGADVAYGYTTSGVDTASAAVDVRDLATGRQLRSEPATTGRLGVESVQTVAAVVVKADGAVAWIGEGGSIIHGSRTTEVNRADAHGLARLDSGSGIDTRSLRLRRSTVSWRRDGRARSAPLS